MFRCVITPVVRRAPSTESPIPRKPRVATAGFSLKAGTQSTTLRLTFLGPARTHQDATSPDLTLQSLALLKLPREAFPFMLYPGMPENLLQMAQRHVLTGARILDRQRLIVASLKARGVDTRRAERTLKLFEDSQAIFEDDLAAILLKLERAAMAVTAPPIPARRITGVRVASASC